MRERLAALFEAWGRLVYRRAGWWIVGCLGAVAALATWLPHLEVDTSTESFLAEDDPVRKTYEAFRAVFGREEMIVVAVEPPEIFDLGFLEKLRALHEELESEVPKLQEVTSLVNVRHTRGEGDELIVEDLMEEWPETEAQLAVIRERALGNPLYRNHLIDADARLTVVLLETDAYSSLAQAPADELGGFEESGVTPEERPFLTGEENSAIVEAVLEVVARHEAPEFPLSVSGSPTMIYFFQKSMLENMRLFGALSIATIAVFLGALFRRAVGVLLPLLVSLLSVVCTLALMAAADLRIMVPQQILPSFLLAVGVGGAVHILVIFFQRLETGAGREECIVHALGHSGVPVVMTSLTTAGGLGSFAAADLAPIGQLGISAPVGVMIALLLTLVLVPAVLAVAPLRPRRSTAAAPGAALRRLLARCGDFAIEHRRPMLLVWAGVLVLSGLGAAQLRFSHDPIVWFPEDNPFRVSAELLNERMGGSMFFEVLIDSGAENGLHEPALLNRMDQLRRRAGAIQYGDLRVGKTTSLVDVVKETHQALNENRPAFHRIPQDRQLVAQELLLFENSGSDDLEQVVDSTFRTGRFTLKAPFVDAVVYPGFLEIFEREATLALGDTPYQVTGLMAIMGRTFTAVMYSMARSYVVALLVIAPLMVVLIGNLRVGLLSMIPNLAPLLTALGVMGWMGLPLDAFTLMIGGIALGLAVDDTIHFMHNFRRYYEQSGDVPGAVRQTLSTTGQAMLFTTLVLSSGFLIYVFADLSNLVTFGWLTGFTILLAFLSDLLLAPALVAVAVGRRRTLAPRPHTDSHAEEGIS